VPVRHAREPQHGPSSRAGQRRQAGSMWQIGRPCGVSKGGCDLNLPLSCAGKQARRQAERQACGAGCDINSDAAPNTLCHHPALCAATRHPPTSVPPSRHATSSCSTAAAWARTCPPRSAAACGRRCGACHWSYHLVKEGGSHSIPVLCCRCIRPAIDVGRRGRSQIRCRRALASQPLTGSCAGQAP
jgi:hypothetical protein